MAALRGRGGSGRGTLVSHLHLNLWLGISAVVVVVATCHLPLATCTWINQKVQKENEKQKCKIQNRQRKATNGRKSRMNCNLRWPRIKGGKIFDLITEQNRIHFHADDAETFICKWFHIRKDYKAQTTIRYRLHCEPLEKDLETSIAISSGQLKSIHHA